MEESEHCRTDFLDDLPAEKDSLGSDDQPGPHERVADALADLLCLEERGMTIGLEGKWGAGKTSVIRFLKEKLKNKNDPSVTVHVFDAWAHQGDPLRRSFLESLIGHLVDEKWVNLAYWNEKIEVLAKRRKTTKTRSVPKPTMLGLWFALSLLLVPLGSALFSWSIQEGITVDSSQNFAWKDFNTWLFLISSLLILLPIGVLIGNLCCIWRVLLCRCLRFNRLSSEADRAKRRKKAKQCRCPRVNRAKNWAFLTADKTTETVQDSTETPDPTSIEFEKCFRELMCCALSGKKNRRAVIVLDNIDRMDPADALAIWATLQTFLQRDAFGDDSPDGSNEWRKRLWVVVPYDPSGLRGLWDKDAPRASTSEDRAASGDSEPKQEDTKREELVSQSFFDKSFQLRFEVPPPVLSNWKQYVIKLANKALPKHKHSEDALTIYQVFNAFRDPWEAPTPRELKLYVNQIGAFHRLWGHEFPIGHMAYYVTLQRRGLDILGELRDGSVPEHEVGQLSQENFSGNLAAMYFNQDRDTAMQLLLADPIWRVLTENKPSELKQLQDTHEAGFWAVLGKVVVERLKDEKSVALGHVAQCVEESGLDPSSNQDEYEKLIDKLRAAVCDLDEWDLGDSDKARGACAVARLTEKLDCTESPDCTERPDCTESIVNAVKKYFAPPDGHDETLTVNEDLIRGWLTFVEEIERLSPGALPQDGFSLHIEARAWVDACAVIAKVDRESKLVEHLRPSCSEEEVQEVLQERISGGKANEIENAITVMEESRLKPDWKPVVVAVGERLKENSVEGSDTTILLKLLSDLRRYESEQVNGTTKALVEGNFICERLRDPEARASKDCKGWCLATYARRRPGFAAPPEYIEGNPGHDVMLEVLDQDDEEMATAFVDACKADDNLGVLLECIDKRNDMLFALIGRSLMIVAEADDGRCEELYTPEKVIEHLVWLQTHLDDDKFSKLLGHLVKKTNLIEGIQAKEGRFNPEKAGLYLKIVVASDGAADFMEWCGTGLKVVTRAAWQDYLDKENEVVYLLAELGNRVFNFAADESFRDELGDYAVKILEGSAEPTDRLVGVVTGLVGSLSDDASREELAGRLLTQAINKDGKCPGAFFEMFGSLIEGHGKLASRDVVSRLFGPLVRERTLGGVKWLAEVAQRNEDLLDSLGEEDVAKFRDRIKTSLGEPPSDKNVAEAIETLAKSWGIEVPPEEPEADGNDGDANDSGG